MIVDVCKNVLQLAKGARRIPDYHRPCFTQNAWTASLLTNSPRSASASDSAKDVSSSTLIGNRGKIVLSGELQNNSGECVLGLRRQPADSLDGAFEELGHHRSIADTGETSTACRLRQRLRADGG